MTKRATTPAVQLNYQKRSLEMPLLINTKHAPGRSLQDIYEEMTSEQNDSLTKERGQGMLNMIEIIVENFPNTGIWGLTSIGRLVLQTEDDWKSKWFIIVSCLGSEYHIEYLLPEDRQPWPSAYVRGTAHGIIEAKKYLLTAMKECGAWDDNLELMNALK